jgi:serine/threonine protein kinase
MALGRLGDYQILERIGAGGMGVVFRARDVGLGVLRAVKVISPERADEPEYLRRRR